MFASNKPLRHSEVAVPIGRARASRTALLNIEGLSFERGRAVGSSMARTGVILSMAQKHSFRAATSVAALNLDRLGSRIRRPSSVVARGTHLLRWPSAVASSTLGHQLQEQHVGRAA